MSALCPPIDPLAGPQWYVAVEPAPRPDSARYRRRRLVVAMLGVALVAAAALGVRAGSASEGVPASGSGRPPPATYLVRPGDTLWSIAGQVHPGGDRRSVVAELIERNGGDQLHVGQVLVVPAAGPGDEASRRTEGVGGRG